MTGERHRSSSVLSDGSPADKHDKCYYILVLVGTGLLLPWNAVLTAFSYFADTYGSWTNLSVPLLNQAANLIFMLLMVKYSHNFSFTRRIVTALIIYVICLCAIPCLSFLAEGQKTFALIITFLIFVVFGATCAVLQASLFGLCGSLPPEYTNAVMAGSAISGVLMNVLMMVTKALLHRFYDEPDDATSTVKIQAFIFFGFSAVFCVFCIFGYLYIVRKPFIQFHVDHLHSMLEAEDPEETEDTKKPAPHADVPSLRPSGEAAELTGAPKTPELTGLASSTPSRQERSGSVQPSGNPSLGKRRVGRSASQDQMMSAHFGDADAAARVHQWISGETMHASPHDYSLRQLMEPARRRQRASTTTSVTPQQSREDVGGAEKEDLEQPFVGTGEGRVLGLTDEVDLDIEPTISVVLAKVQGYGIAVMSIFFVSLYIFPGFLHAPSLCASGFWGSGKNADTWMGLVLLTAFNVTDLAGRVVAPAVGRAFFKTRTLYKIYVISFLRLGFVPIAWLPVEGVMDTVYTPLIMTLFLGATNGCLGSLCMMYAPQEAESHEQELAGTIMSVFLMLGITTGALAQDAMTPVLGNLDCPRS